MRTVIACGSQPGRIALKERQLRVRKPRLRRKGAGRGERAELSIPAYEAMQKDCRRADCGDVWPPPTSLIRPTPVWAAARGA